MKRVMLLPLLLQFALTDPFASTSVTSESSPEVIQKNEDQIQISYSSEMSLKDIIKKLEETSQLKWHEIIAVKNEDLIPNDYLILGSSSSRIDMILVYMGDDQFMKVTQISENVMDAEIIHMTLGSANEYAYQIILRTEHPVEQLRDKIEMPVITNTDEKKDSVEPIVSESKDNKICYTFDLIDKTLLPLITLSNVDGSMEKALDWIKEIQVPMQNLIELTGGCLLRGIPINHAQDFANVIENILNRSLIEYRGGEEQQKSVVNKVYQSKEGQPSFNVPLHHEFSATKNPLDFICFCCNSSDISNAGQMTIGSTMFISSSIKNKPHIWEFFEGKNLQYISRHPPKDHIISLLNPTHKNWADIFGTTVKEEVDAICQRKKLDYRWVGNWIEIIRTVPAIREADNIFDQPYWFNQIHIYHPKSKFQGNWKDYFLSSLLYLFPSTRPYDVKLENGEEIPAKFVEEISSVIEFYTSPISMQKGDILILDNIRTMHGRTAYTDGRSMWVTMIQHSPSTK